MKVFEISAGLARDYFKHNVKPGEQVSWNKSGRFFGAFKEGSIVGIISRANVGSATRIRCFHVSKSFRKQGAGESLLREALIESGKATAYATKFSKRLFEKSGFVVQTTKKNGVTFMTKEVSDG